MGPTNGDTTTLDATRAWLARGNGLVPKEGGGWVYVSPSSDPPPDGVLKEGDVWIVDDKKKPKHPLSPEQRAITFLLLLVGVCFTVIAIETSILIGR